MADQSIIKHVTLRVANLERSLRFYSDVVGLELLDLTEDRARLGVGGELLLNLEEDGDAPRRGRDEAGLFHIAFRVPHKPALGDALARIRRHHHLTGASDHGVSHALYLNDPDQNGLEIYYDLPRKQWPRDAKGRINMITAHLDLQGLSDGPSSSSPDQFPASTDVGHVHLKITNMDEAHRFYVELLGLQPVMSAPSVLFVAANDYHHHVGLNRWNGRRHRRHEASRGLVAIHFEPLNQDREQLLAKASQLGFEAHREDEALRLVDANGLTWLAAMSP